MEHRREILRTIWFTYSDRNCNTHVDTNRDSYCNVDTHGNTYRDS